MRIFPSIWLAGRLNCLAFLIFKHLDGCGIIVDVDLCPIIPKIFEDEQFVPDIKSVIAKVGTNSHGGTGALRAFNRE